MYFGASTPKPTTMPIKHLAFFAIAVCLLVSCKKNSGSNANGNSNKLKMYIEADKLSNGIAETDTFYVTYDNDSRITALTGTQLKQVYTYQSSKTFTFDLYEYNQLNIHEIFYLNSASVVDSTLQYDNTND